MRTVFAQSLKSRKLCNRQKFILDFSDWELDFLKRFIFFEDLCLGYLSSFFFFFFENLFLEICPLKICLGNFAFRRCVYGDLSIAD